MSVFKNVSLKDYDTAIGKDYPDPNSILSDTNIKRACCFGFSPGTDSKTISVRIPDYLNGGKGYKNIPLTIKKSDCPAGYVPTTENGFTGKCDNFYTLYCNNLLKLDPYSINDTNAKKTGECGCILGDSTKMGPVQCADWNCYNNSAAYRTFANRTPCTYNICNQVMSFKNIHAMNINIHHDKFTNNCSSEVAALKERGPGPAPVPVEESNTGRATYDVTNAEESDSSTADVGTPNSIAADDANDAGANAAGANAADNSASEEEEESDVYVSPIAQYLPVKYRKYSNYISMGIVLILLALLIYIIMKMLKKPKHTPQPLPLQRQYSQQGQFQLPPPPPLQRLPPPPPPQYHPQQYPPQPPSYPPQQLQQQQPPLQGQYGQQGQLQQKYDPLY